MNFLLSKKAEMGLNDILPAVIILVSAGIISGAGVLVNSKIQNIAAAESNNVSYYIVGNASAAINQVSNFYPTIGIVIAAVIIITLIITAFKFKGE